MPTAAEIAASGFAPEDFATDDADVWPENWPAVSLLLDIDTQWRHGFNGPVGLDYNVLFSRMDRMRLNDPDHEQLFEDIRTLEREALQLMRASP